MWVGLLTVSAALALLFGNVVPALAGGVIIDGRGVGTKTETMVSNRTEPAEEPTTEDEAATAQQIYLWASMIFYATEPAEIQPSDHVQSPTKPLLMGSTPYAIVDGFELDGEGGCRAVPSSGIVALACLWLLRRRRR